MNPSFPSRRVVLLHGLMRTHRSFFRLSRVLCQRGWAVTCPDYPSMQLDIAGAAAYIQEHVLTPDFWDEPGPVAFVTHSLGGLVLHQILENLQNKISSEKIGPVVMLGPPLKGSEIADLWSRIPLYHRLFGPVGLELTTKYRAHVPLNPFYRLGVIAGNYPALLYLDALFFMKRPHDGRVRVDFTRIPGAADHIVLPVSHSHLLNSRAVWQQTLYFLEHQRFYRGS